MDAEVRKNSKQTLHIIITLLLMFGIGFIPPMSQLTVSGMKLLGILLGMIYGCSFCSPAWPCLLGMAAMAITGAAPASTIIATGVGSDSIWLMILFSLRYWNKTTLLKQWRPG